MAEIRLRPKKTLKSSVDDFLFDWHQFPIDYWWRKRYHVSFGSPEHRAMNFIDMLIEFEEEVEINKAVYSVTDDDFGIGSLETVKMTDEEIDNDFADLDLSQFDKK